MKTLAVFVSVVFHVVGAAAVPSQHQVVRAGNLRISTFQDTSGLGSSSLRSGKLRTRTRQDTTDQASGINSDVCEKVRIQKKYGSEVKLVHRDSPVRVVDFIQFGNVHEIPILRLRLEEMGDFVDEIHVAEGDRDFSGGSKDFVFQKVLATDPVVSRWRSKITHHAVSVPLHLQDFEIQRHVIAAKDDIPGSGILLEGDLDEVISRTTLLSLRYCKPISGDWFANIKMDVYMYNMGWTGGDWMLPSLAHSYSRNNIFTHNSSHGNGTFDVDNKTRATQSNDVDQTKYVYHADDSIVCVSGMAGWHLAWMLDGADGIAHKIMYGRIESAPDWAAPHTYSEKHLANWIRKEFLPNPDHYDHNIRRTNLHAHELPEIMVQYPERYKALLGDAYPVAVAGHKEGAPVQRPPPEVQGVSLIAEAVSTPCACQSSGTTWKRTARTQPQCIFIDLGAADGNSFATFLSGSFGDVANCPSGGSYTAFLVEANPEFKPALDEIENAHRQSPKEKVHALAPEAAYMCRGKTSFYIDTVNHANNYWGSSMSDQHPDVKKSGHVHVTVPTVNIIELVAENTIPDDWVTVKMDIEGAEWDILPCLADSPNAALIDQLLVEFHPSSLGTAGTSEAEMQSAVAKLKSKGIRMPDYNSNTL